VTNSGGLGCGFSVFTGWGASDEQPDINTSVSIAIGNFFMATFLARKSNLATGNSGAHSTRWS
jgi:hypothetical protein